MVQSPGAFDSISKKFYTLKRTNLLATQHLLIKFSIYPQCNYLYMLSPTLYITFSQIGEFQSYAFDDSLFIFNDDITSAVTCQAKPRGELVELLEQLAIAQIAHHLPFPSNRYQSNISQGDLVFYEHDSSIRARHFCRMSFLYAK